MLEICCRILPVRLELEKKKCFVFNSKGFFCFGIQRSGCRGKTHFNTDHFVSCGGRVHEVFIEEQR